MTGGDQRSQFLAEFAASSFSQIDPSDPDVRENIANAKRQHRKRFRAQLIFWGTTLLTASSAFPLMKRLVGEYSAPACSIAQLSLSCLRVPENFALAVIAAITTIAWLYNHFWYLRERKHDWETALSDAQAMISAEKTAEGNTNLFRIYVQTKRRSYWLITLLFASAITSLAYITARVQTDQSAMHAPNPLGLLLVLLAAAGCIGLFRAAYLLGSSFAPGEVIVRHIIALAVLAVSSITDIAEVRRQVEDRTRDFVKRSPWWFYTG
jgi:hypothetical protein